MDEKLKRELTKRPSVMSELSFMTELNKSKDGILNNRILEYQAAINTQLTELDQDLDSVLTRHEQDFLNAFKIQLFKLYSQIKELKKAANTTDIYIKHQEEVANLHKIIEETKNNSYKLEQQVEEHKKEAAGFKSKIRDLEKECKTLQEKLKSVKRKMKKNLMIEQKEVDEPCEKYEKVPDPKVKQFEKIDFVPSCKSGETVLGILNAYGKVDVNFLKEIESLMEKQSRHFEEASKHLKTVILTERKKFQNYSVASTSFVSQKHDLESVFLDCVEEVKREVNHRRVQSLNLQKYPTKTLRMPKETGQFFTPGDKRKIIELLINNDKVLTMLYEALFPFRASNYQAKKKEPYTKLAKSQEDLLPIISTHSRQASLSVPNNY